jgi:hypothetical protein
MFVLGHIGIGRTVIGESGRRLPTIPLLFGMLLPDLIDKPLYYAHLSSVISCTRTFAHTGVFLLIVLAFGLARRSRATTAVGVGIATHLALDCFLDGVNSVIQGGIGSGVIAFVWPLLGWQFVVHDTTAWNHLMTVLSLPVMVSEVIGGLLLAAEYLRSRARPA